MRQQAFIRPSSNKSRKPPTTLARAYEKLVEAEKLRIAGDLDKAMSICERLVDEFPEYVGALQTLGAAHVAKKNYWEALSCFAKVAMRCPKDWKNLTNLAAMYAELEATELATITLEQARRLKPDDPEIYFRMGEIYQEDCEYELAEQSFLKALELDPNYAVAANGIGECYSNFGRYSEAAAAHEKVHKLRPEFVGCLYGLTQLPQSVVNIDIMEALDKLRSSSRPAGEDFHINYAYALAGALDRKGRYNEAWEQLLEANRGEFFSKHEAGYRRQLARQLTSRTAAVAHAGTLYSDASTSPAEHPLSLFIIGVSRSGKTTLERLIGMIEGTKRGHEGHLIERALERASQMSGLITLSNFSEFPKSLDGEFRKLYLEELQSVASAARIFTTTHPGTIHSVGRLAASLPSCRFVFVKRDPHDLALRIFAKKYRSGNHYAYDIKTIFDYVSWYYEMSDIWLKKLPSVCREIRYEAMIADPRATLQTVAELCGMQMPDGPLPELGDDRGCAAPYREMIAAALTR